MNIKPSIFLLTIILSIGSVFALTITNYEPGNYPAFASNNIYTVKYSITEPGWYLLPSNRALVNYANGQDLASLVEAVDYKFVFSPFTKKYGQCENGACDYEDIYGVSIQELQSLPQDTVMNDYLTYTTIAADWHYYSRPVTIEYQYFPFMLQDFGNNLDFGVGLFGSRLKKGWNLITYNPYLAHEEIELGDCSIERMYAFDDGDQSWAKIDENDYIRKELSGFGIAVKVTNDCNFLASKESNVAPSTIPE